MCRHSKPDRDEHPYAFMEIIVTHTDSREQGLAAECLGYAKQIAQQWECNKMMFLTGSKEKVTLVF